MSAPYICLYMDYLETFLTLSDPARGRLVTAMLNYAATGEEPQLKGREQTVWPQLRGQIQRDLAKYQHRCEVNRANAARRGKSDGERSLAMDVNTNTNTKTNTNMNTNTNTNTNSVGLLRIGTIL